MKTLTLKEIALFTGQEAECQLIGMTDKHIRTIDGELLFDLENHLRDYPEQEFVIKPILRTLDKMTDQEVIERTNLTRVMALIKPCIGNEIPIEFIKAATVLQLWFIRKGFDVLQWIEHGLAIDKSTIK